MNLRDEPATTPDASELGRAGLLRSVWTWALRISAGIALACLLLWLLAQVWGHVDTTFRWTEMFDKGRRFGMQHGFIFLNVTRAPTDEELKLRLEFDRLLQAAIAQGGVKCYVGTTSRSSGDMLLFVGWKEEWETMVIGSRSAVFNRHVAIWINPIGGAILGALPLIINMAVRSWRSRTSVTRSRMGLCVKCGYDLRASAERCPECGTPISRHQIPDSD